MSCNETIDKKSHLVLEKCYLGSKRFGSWVQLSKSVVDSRLMLAR
jgi:hypothetical protein